MILPKHYKKLLTILAFLFLSACQTTPEISEEEEVENFVWLPEIYQANPQEQAIISFEGDVIRTDNEVFSEYVCLADSDMLEMIRLYLRQVQ